MLGAGIMIAAVIILAPWLLLGWIVNTAKGTNKPADRCNDQRYYDAAGDNMFYIGYMTKMDQIRHREEENRHGRY